MTAGIVENMDILHQLAKEFNLGDNYDWFSDSKNKIMQFFTMNYSPVYSPQMPQNSKKTEAERKKMQVKFNKVSDLMTAVMGSYDLNDNGEMRKMFSDLYTGKTNDALVPLDEDEPASPTATRTDKTVNFAEGTSTAPADKKKPKSRGRLIGSRGGYDFYVKKDSKGNAKMVKVKSSSGK